MCACYFFTYYHYIQNESFKGHHTLFVHSFFFLLFFSDCLENESKVCISCDAGHYLCDFVFYKSLHSSQGKSLFIHVPTLNKPFSKEELAAIIVQAKSLYISKSHVDSVVEVSLIEKEMIGYVSTGYFDAKKSKETFFFYYRDTEFP